MGKLLAHAAQKPHLLDRTKCVIISLHARCYLKIITSMPRLSLEQRKRAIGMMAIGATQGHVSKTLGCSRTTISRLVRCYRTTDQTNDSARNARSDVTTPRIYTDASPQEQILLR